jgi:hypothetical protein
MIVIVHSKQIIIIHANDYSSQVGQTNDYSCTKCLKYIIRYSKKSLILNILNDNHENKISKAILNNLYNTSFNTSIVVVHSMQIIIIHSKQMIIIVQIGQIIIVLQNV